MEYALFLVSCVFPVALAYQYTSGYAGLASPFSVYSGNSIFGVHGGGINNNVPYITTTSKQGVPNLIGRQVFSEYHSAVPTAHGIAVTISQSSNVIGGSVFGDSYYGFSGSLGGQGLAMSIQIQTSNPGYYHIVLTSQARTKDGCTADTLGNVLDYSHKLTYNPLGLFGGVTSSHSELPDGVIADVELGRNIPKSIHLGRLRQFTRLEELAGRGVALCEASTTDSRQKPCPGRIVACTGIHYSNDPIELGFVELPQSAMEHRPGQPYLPQPHTPPQAPYPPPPPYVSGPPQPPVPPHHPGPVTQYPASLSPPPLVSTPPELLELPYDPSYQPEEPRLYYDMDTEPYYDSDHEMLDTYSPPPLPPTPDYDPFGTRQYLPPRQDGPFLTGTLQDPNYFEYPLSITDAQFGLKGY